MGNALKALVLVCYSTAAMSQDVAAVESFTPSFPPPDFLLFLAAPHKVSPATTASYRPVLDACAKHIAPHGPSSERAGLATILSWCGARDSYEARQVLKALLLSCISLHAAAGDSNNDPVGETTIALLTGHKNEIAPVIHRLTSPLRRPESRSSVSTKNLFWLLLIGLPPFLVYRSLSGQAAERISQLAASWDRRFSQINELQQKQAHTQAELGVHIKAVEEDHKKTLANHEQGLDGIKEQVKNLATNTATRLNHLDERLPSNLSYDYSPTEADSERSNVPAPSPGSARPSAAAPCTSHAKPAISHAPLGGTGQSSHGW